MRPQPGTAAGRWGLPGAPPRSEQERVVGEAGGAGSPPRTCAFVRVRGFIVKPGSCVWLPLTCKAERAGGWGGGPSGRKVPWRALGEALRVRAGVGVGDLQRVQGCWHPPLSPIPRTWGGPEIAEGLESQALPDLVSTAGL